jgi:ATP-dependent helicase/nuclease subunit A
MDFKTALDPRASVVVEACAGSGKTWLLVSRIVRLLLAGVAPGEILAITFTRRAAQEMQARLHEWLNHLAVADDAEVEKFLRERGIEHIDEMLLKRSRSLYRELLLAHPSITISTFHGWFIEIIRHAPLNSGIPVGVQLLERTHTTREEAWQALMDELRMAPNSERARAMLWLFDEYGLHSTRALLEKFTAKRAEWWAYAGEGENAVAFALERLRAEFAVDLNADPVREAHGDPVFRDSIQAFARALATGSDKQQSQANGLEAALGLSSSSECFAALLKVLCKTDGEFLAFKATRGQNADAFNRARDALLDKVSDVRNILAAQEALHMNQAALRCGVALLAHYQSLKRSAQQMDFNDLEWQTFRMLKQSDCAEYMQYKLDSRYRHVLLDEFQDSNPLQWQILQAWFQAASAAGLPPTVFMVGDPKQSIYRFRRAEARLFLDARRFMQQEFSAHYLTQNETRRNSPAVLDAVNTVFSPLPDGFADFEAHTAHHAGLPGYVEVLPLAASSENAPPDSGEMPALRNPLTTPRVQKPDGARELEARQFAQTLRDIINRWRVQNPDGTWRAAQYGDIMVLVRKRTHLRTYERALRALHIPFLTSRRGGLLETLEAEDLQALLKFLIIPFADLALSHALRCPIFACTDDELVHLAQDGEGSWWGRLVRSVQSGAASPNLSRAHHLLQHWLTLADKLPVHDLLDRIYFEGDVSRRYAAALPLELRGAAAANLQAFIEIALNVDAGRYPSLPRFLAELRELRQAENESPDEGVASEAGNALRIYTVHEAKGLEAPIVWLLDANDMYSKADSYDVLLDWPPAADTPAHFSMFASRSGIDARRAHYLEAEAHYDAREKMNLLYVAMTRAKQALIVSGVGARNSGSWYDRIAAAVEPCDNPLLAAPLANTAQEPQPEPAQPPDPALLLAIPVGRRKPEDTPEQQSGTRLHALLQHLAPASGRAWRGTPEELQQRLNIPATEMPELLAQAEALLARPELQRFFDARQYRAAFNEMAYVNAQGAMKRIDRLVEFDDEVWVLDYKTGRPDASPYRAQMEEYRTAMAAAYPGKNIHCALLFAGGELCKI